MGIGNTRQGNPRRGLAHGVEPHGPVASGYLHDPVNGGERILGGGGADLPLLQPRDQVGGITAQGGRLDVPHVPDPRLLTRPTGELAPAIGHRGDRTVALHSLAQGAAPGIAHIPAAEAKIS